MASTAQISFTWDAAPKFGTVFHNVIMAQKPGQPVVFSMDASYEKPPNKRNMRRGRRRHPNQSRIGPDRKGELQDERVDPRQGRSL